jgi:hypothetical protein
MNLGGHFRGHDCVVTSSGAWSRFNCRTDLAERANSSVGSAAVHGYTRSPL